MRVSSLMVVATEAAYMVNLAGDGEVTHDKHDTFRMEPKFAAKKKTFQWTAKPVWISSRIYAAFASTVLQDERLKAGRKHKGASADFLREHLAAYDKKYRKLQALVITPRNRTQPMLADWDPATRADHIAGLPRPDRDARLPSVKDMKRRVEIIMKKGDSKTLAKMRSLSPEQQARTHDRVIERVFHVRQRAPLPKNVRKQFHATNVYLAVPRGRTLADYKPKVELVLGGPLLFDHDDGVVNDIDFEVRTLAQIVTFILSPDTPDLAPGFAMSYIFPYQDRPISMDTSHMCPFWPMSTGQSFIDYFHHFMGAGFTLLDACKPLAATVITSLRRWIRTMPEGLRLRVESVAENLAIFVIDSSSRFEHVRQT